MSTKDDINRLVQRPRAEKRLPGASTPAAIRGKTGLERKTRGDVNSEEIHAVSTDGLFSFTVRVIKT